MATFNFINNVEVTPMGKQKAFLLNLSNTDKCNAYGCDYNGYGYANKARKYTLTDEELKIYNSLLPSPKKDKKVKTEDDIINSWAKRLNKLAPEISIEIAKEIAIEKINYKNEKINDMIDRQLERGNSRKRDKLINKMQRETPLRPIKNYEHAMAIVAASERHNNTNYECALDHARELAEIGEIDKSEVKDWARQNYIK